MQYKQVVTRQMQVVETLDFSLVAVFPTLQHRLSAMLITQKMFFFFPSIN